MIPKIIHYCWFGKNEMPEKDKKNIENWKQICPDYEIVFWNEDNYDVTKVPYMKEAYEAGKLGFVPDYVRTEIIYKYGGFYFDTDVELLKPLDDLLDNQCIVGFEHINSVNNGQGFAAEPNNDILRELLEFYNSIHFINPEGTLNMVSSPVYLTKLLVKHGLVLNNKEQMVQNIHVFPTDFFCPKNYITGEITVTDNTYSIHHFNLS